VRANRHARTTSASPRKFNAGTEQSHDPLLQPPPTFEGWRELRADAMGLLAG
jgi:hypothetical protein